MRDIEHRLAQQWVTGQAEEWIEKTDPADGSLVARVPVSPPEAIEAAVKAARAAAPGWVRTPAALRSAAVAAAALAIEQRADDLAWLTTRETGRPLGEALAGVAGGVATLRQYAEIGPLHCGRSLAGEWGASDLMVYEPRGVAAVLTPWNDPVAVSCGLLGAALVTGNTVIYKPSERTPATGWLLADLVAAQLPEGVLTALSGGGRVGSRLVEHDVDVVAHVGSTATGRRIARLAALTGAKVLLENGGNDPLIVDADVDPRWAAAQAATGAFANAGQLCVAVERIYVHERVVEPFLAALASRANGIRVAGGRSEGAELGPLVDRALRESVHEQVSEAVRDGARVLAGGRVPGGPGAFYPPTVLADCTDQMRVMREETFGPVAPVAAVGSFEEAVARAASGEYGLAATVLTGSMAHAQQAWRELPTGTVKVNNVFGGAPGGAAHPRGASGQGYGYGPELLDEFTVTKVVHLEAAPVAARLAVGG
jgi:acyl-CoA reductase-like NAD-dependent aldehyde dehydrogenase